MYYHYLASQSDGRTIEGDIEASKESEALAFLASKGLRPVSLKAIRGAGTGRRSIFGGKITVEDKVFLVKYLSLMMSVGTDLFKAIDILVADFEKPAMKNLMIQIRGSLEKGQPFYTTFEKYPQYFSPVFVNLIKAGESSGNLTKVFEDLSVSLAKEKELRSKIKSAMTYPIILLSMSFLMLIFLTTFALPKIAGVFSGSNVKPPIFSRIVFAVGLFLNDNLFIVLGASAFLGIVFWFVFFWSLKGRRFMKRLFTKLPVIKNTLREIAFQRFASTWSSLLKAGLPILDSLEITAETVGYENLREALLRIARDGIGKGLGIGESFRREKVFPRVVADLMAISEKAGHMDSVLQTLATFYESEIESSIKVLISFLEPVLLLGIGAVIGTIALAIIVPVYQLVGSFS